MGAGTFVATVGTPVGGTSGGTSGGAGAAAAPARRPVVRVDVYLTLLATLAAVAAYVVTLLVDVRPPRGVAVLLFTLAPAAAAATAYLLGTWARAADDQPLRWVATAVGVACVAIVLQLISFPSVDPRGGPLRTDDDGSSALYLLWHLLVALGALVAAAQPRAAPPRMLVPATVALIVVVALPWTPLPALLSPDGTYTPLLVGLELALAALTAAAAIRWIGNAGRRPVAPHAWVAVLLALSAADIALNAFAAHRFTAVWWASAVVRATTYTLPLAGLLVTTLRQLRLLDVYAEREVSRAETRARASADITEGLLASATALARAVGMTEVADVVVRTAAAGLGCRYAIVQLLDEAGTALRQAAVLGYDEISRRRLRRVPLAVDLPMTLVVRDGRPWYAETPEELAAFPELARLIVFARPGALAAAPMILSGRPVGALTVWDDRPRTFSAGERELLVALAAQAAQALERASLYERQRSLADMLQHSLLPDRLPDLPAVALAARYLPASHGVDVGGDWYDCLELADGRLALVIGDVMGKGVRAATVMGQIRNAVRAYATLDPDPAAVLAGLDRLAATFPPDEIVTLAYLVLDPATGSVSIARAGHLPPMLLSAGAEPRFLEGGASPPLGVPTGHRATGVDAVPPGSLVLLYTDGLVEDRHAGLDRGMPALAAAAAAAFAAAPRAHPEKLLDDILSTLGVFAAREDDVTVLAARRCVPVAAGATAPARPGSEPHTDDLAVAGIALGEGSSAAATARRFVRSTLTRWVANGTIRVDADAVDDAEQCAHELVANALMHADGPLRLRLAATATHVHLAVVDATPELPARPPAPELYETTGRGLAIVDALASAWGAERRGDGKIVWCELAQRS
ncbi:MAG: SpoIIE family protein phosphatase [Mycobacterium leprae]